MPPFYLLAALVVALSPVNVGLDTVPAGVYVAVELWDWPVNVAMNLAGVPVNSWLNVAGVPVNVALLKSTVVDTEWVWAVDATLVVPLIDDVVADEPVNVNILPVPVNVGALTLVALS